MPRSRLRCRTKKRPKRVLALPDLEQAKAAVLNSLTSARGQRTYDHALTEFVAWYCSEPRLAFSRTVVRRYRIDLEQRHYAPATIKLRLAAVRRVATRRPMLVFSVRSAARPLRCECSPLDAAVTGLREEYLHQLALGLHLTIVCGEDLPFGAPDTISALRAEYARACRGWPAAPVATNFHEPVRLSTPALILVGEWDPVTSPRWARAAADQFSPSHLIVFPKAGHALPAFGGCAGALVASFLAGAAIDDSCAARPERPPYVVR